MVILTLVLEVYLVLPLSFFPLIFTFYPNFFFFPSYEIPFRP